MLQPSRRAVAVLGVIGAIALLQGFLATRRDLDDHARFTSAVYMSAARNYVRYGFLREAGVPLKSGGSYELAREARYLNWPVREFLELGAWFQAFGVSVPVARARTVVWTLVGLAALAWGVWGIPRSGLRGARANAALLPLALGTCPFVVYYAHAATPQAVTVAAVSVAMAARLRRLEGTGGRGVLALHAGAVLVAVSTTWEGLLFPLVWAVVDARARRRDGPVVLGLALAVVAGQVAYLVAMGGASTWLATASIRTTWPLLTTMMQVTRYGRGLGYAHVLLAGAWAVLAFRRARCGQATALDARALELLLAPLPWFLVFHQHVATNDVEMMYFAPGVALAAWLALEELAGRSWGTIRVALATGALVLTGVAIGGDIEHRDDWVLPRELGVAARSASAFDQAVATSSLEFSLVWEADRFVHLEVRTEAELDRLLARGGKLAPVAFVLPAGEVTDELGRALGRRSPSTRVGSALVFDLRGGMTRKSEVAARPIAIIEASPFRP